MQRVRAETARQAVVLEPGRVAAVLGRLPGRVATAWWRGWVAVASVLARAGR